MTAAGDLHEAARLVADVRAVPTSNSSEDRAAAKAIASATDTLCAAILQRLEKSLEKEADDLPGIEEYAEICVAERLLTSRPAVR
jgi:hypothetical protein